MLNLAKRKGAGEPVTIDYRFTNGHFCTSSFQAKQCGHNHWQVGTSLVGIASGGVIVAGACFRTGRRTRTNGRGAVQAGQVGGIAVIRHHPHA